MANTADDRTLNEYLGAVAAGTSTPGGGSVAAIVGALAAALGEMAANLTLGRKRYAGAEASLQPARDRLTILRQQMAAAAREDEHAYAAYRAAASLPRRSAREKAARNESLQTALLAATTAPLGVAEAAAETAEIMTLIADIANPHLRADAALGALLAEAALRGALLNVRGNAAMLRDTDLANQYIDRARSLEVRGRGAAGAAYRRATSVDVPDAQMLSS